MESLDQGTPETQTAVITRPSAVGGDDDPIKALTRRRGRLISYADRLITRLKIDRNALDGEGAVDLALAELREREGRDRDHPFRRRRGVLQTDVRGGATGRPAAATTVAIDQAGRKGKGQDHSQARTRRRRRT